MKKAELQLNCYTIHKTKKPEKKQKYTWIGITDLNLCVQYIWLFDFNFIKIREKLFPLGKQNFPKVQLTEKEKYNKFDFSKLKTFALQKTL